MAKVNIRLNEIFAAPGNVQVTVKSELVGGSRNVITGLFGILPGQKSQRTDGSGLTQFVLSAGRYRVQAQSASLASPAFSVLIDVPDNNVEYELPELIVDDGSAGLVTDIGTTSYTQAVMALAGFRIANGSVQLWNEDQGAWFPIFVRGAIGAEEISLGDADVSVAALSSVAGYTRAAMEAVGMRIRVGQLELWNEDQAAWFPLFVRGAVGAEELALGEADTNP
jgi:hypothetical protein